MASASLVSMAGCRHPVSQTEPRTPQRMHTKEDTSENARQARRPRSVETSTAVCEGVHRESHPQPCHSLRGRIQPVPIVPASEEAWNICKRGRDETMHEAREQRTNQQSESMEAQTNHQTVIAASQRRHRSLKRTGASPRRDTHKTYQLAIPPIHSSRTAA